MNNKKQTIGLWDKGKGTELHNVSIDGFDIGIKSEGEDLYANNIDLKGSEKKIKFYEIWWIKFIIFPILSAYIIFIFGWN